MSENARTVCHHAPPATHGTLRACKTHIKRVEFWADFVAKVLTDRFKQSVLGGGITFAFGCGERSGNARSVTHSQAKVISGLQRWSSWESQLGVGSAHA